jgi:hypothetical protein
MRLALVLSIFAGCANEATLSQLASKVIFVSVSATGGLGVELQYTSAHCQSIGDDVRATFNGEALELFTEGGGTLAATGDACEFPLWESPTPDIAPVLAAFSLSDKSATLTASFVNLFVDRGYTLTSPAQATAGDTVSLAWSPTTDVDDPNKLNIVFAPSGGAGAMVAQGAQITAAGGALSFTVPPTAPKGVGNLLVIGDADAQVASCVGADRCEATFQVASLIPFTID